MQPINKEAAAQSSRRGEEDRLAFLTGLPNSNLQFRTRSQTNHSLMETVRTSCAEDPRRDETLSRALPVDRRPSCESPRESPLPWQRFRRPPWVWQDRA